MNFCQNLGVVPDRTADPRKALQLLRREGAVILTDIESGEEASRQVGFDVFGDLVLEIPPAARVLAGGEKDRMPEGLTFETRSHAHTDGFSYGDGYPDHFVLKCERHSEVGGESFLIDGYALLDALTKDPDTQWVGEGLRTIEVDQTEPGKRTSISPVVQSGPTGRTMVRRLPDQQPNAESEDPERDRQMLDIWEAAINAAEELVPRFKLFEGEAVIIDNYRLFHGREGYKDLNRMMWRVWIWTKEAKQVPEGYLHSDSRHADAI
tara:strand:- start:2538 stop:3332 length:795 start_codon:yes stop_codon:yes gene_type:complete